jgi:hypothetical protein
MRRLPPPNCEKCSTQMCELASMSPIDLTSKGATVFSCEPCNTVKWIDWTTTAGGGS